MLRIGDVLESVQYKSKGNFAYWTPDVVHRRYNRMWDLYCVSARNVRDNIGSIRFKVGGADEGQIEKNSNVMFRPYPVQAHAAIEMKFADLENFILQLIEKKIKTYSPIVRHLMEVRTQFQPIFEWDRFDDKDRNYEFYLTTGPGGDREILTRFGNFKIATVDDVDAVIQLHLQPAIEANPVLKTLQEMYMNDDNFRIHDITHSQPINRFLTYNCKHNGTTIHVRYPDTIPNTTNIGCKVWTYEPRIREDGTGHRENAWTVYCIPTELENTLYQQIRKVEDAMSRGNSLEIQRSHFALDSKIQWQLAKIKYIASRL